MNLVIFCILCISLAFVLSAGSTSFAKRGSKTAIGHSNKQIRKYSKKNGLENSRRKNYHPIVKEHRTKSKVKNPMKKEKSPAMMNNYRHLKKVPNSKRINSWHRKGKKKGHKKDHSKRTSGLKVAIQPRKKKYRKNSKRKTDRKKFIRPQKVYHKTGTDKKIKVPQKTNINKNKVLSKAKPNNQTSKLIRKVGYPNGKHKKEMPQHNEVIKKKYQDEILKKKNHSEEIKSVSKSGTNPTTTNSLKEDTTLVTITPETRSNFSAPTDTKGNIFETLFMKVAKYRARIANETTTALPNEIMESTPKVESAARNVEVDPWYVFCKGKLVDKEKCIEVDKLVCEKRRKSDSKCIKGVKYRYYYGPSTGFEKKFIEPEYFTDEPLPFAWQYEDKLLKSTTKCIMNQSKQSTCVFLSHLLHYRKDLVYKVMPPNTGWQFEDGVGHIQKTMNNRNTFSCEELVTFFPHLQPHLRDFEEPCEFED